MKAAVVLAVVAFAATTAFALETVSKDAETSATEFFKVGVYGGPYGGQYGPFGGHYGYGYAHGLGYSTGLTKGLGLVGFGHGHLGYGFKPFYPGLGLGTGLGSGLGALNSLGGYGYGLGYGKYGAYGDLGFDGLYKSHYYGGLFK